MSERIKVMVIFGTRPEAIKMAPLIQQLKKRSEHFDPIVVVTAQHREMLDQVLHLFKITPDYDLNMMEHGQTLSSMTTKALLGLESILDKEQPQLVLVHGDTTTTFTAALAAFYKEIDIGHVEAGLRTYNKYSPYPEEINRQMTGVLADIHFAPTKLAKSHLLKENKLSDSIIVTGNTVIDALQTTVQTDYSHPLLQSIGQRKLVLMTAHRRENLGEKMTDIFRAINRLVQTHRDIHVVYPVHLNPQIKQKANKILGDHEQVSLIEPLDVIDFHNFMARATLILTDSGGIQEEAPSLGVPVLVLRDTTERPEGIDAGTLKLVGTDEQTIYEVADQLLTNKKVYDKMAKAKNPYGDGKASKYIVDAIYNYYTT